MIVQGCIARAFFLFERRSQLMIDEGALSDFALQRPIKRRQSLGGIAQVPGRGRIVTEDLPNPRLDFSVYESVLHPSSRCSYRSGGLLDEALYMLALQEHFGEDGPILACPHEPAFFKFFQIFGLRLPVLKRRAVESIARTINLAPWLTIRLQGSPQFSDLFHCAVPLTYVLIPCLEVTPFSNH